MSGEVKLSKQTYKFYVNLTVQVEGPETEKEAHEVLEHIFAAMDSMAHRDNMNTDVTYSFDYGTVK